MIFFIFICIIIILYVVYMLINRRWFLMFLVLCKKKVRFSFGKNGVVDVIIYNFNNVRSLFR